MKTVPAKTAKDQRRVYTNHRIEHEGNVWHIDAKADMGLGVLRVYAVRGDITKWHDLNTALQSFAESESLEHMRF